MTNPSRESTQLGTVLLVEDTSSVRTAIRIILTSGGYAVLEARDGYDATRLWEMHKDHIDLVLTDLRMPQLSGQELATILHAARPTLPVVFMSGDADRGVFQTESKILGQVVMQKPFAPAELLAMIARLLRSQDLSAGA